MGGAACLRVFCVCAACLRVLCVRVCVCARSCDRACARERCARGVILRCEEVRELDVAEDDHILIADKPHFLPVMPGGDYVNECLTGWVVIAEVNT